MTDQYQLTFPALAELGAIAVLVCFDAVENDFDAAVISGIVAADVRFKAKRLGYASTILATTPREVWLSALKKRPDLSSFSAVFAKSSSEAMVATKSHFDGSDLQGKFWRRFASQELTSTSENQYLAATAFILMKLNSEFYQRASSN